MSLKLLPHHIKMFLSGKEKHIYARVSEGSLSEDSGSEKGQYSSPPRFSLQRMSIALNVITLVVIVLGFAASDHILLNKSSLECELPSDKLWGRRIPYKLVTQQNNQDFIDSDPFNGKWNENPYYTPPTDAHSPWDSLYEGSWVGLDTSGEDRLAFGTPLAPGPGYYEGAEDDPTPWKAGEQAFGVAVMHQLHCVAGLKHAINDLRLPGRDGRWANSSAVITHTGKTHFHFIIPIPDETQYINTNGAMKREQDHCIEILRQAVLCHGDLTLQRPDNPNPDPRGYVGITGWGNEHLCRDWDVVREVIAAHSIAWKNDHGWMHKKGGTGYHGGFASHKSG